MPRRSSRSLIPWGVTIAAGLALLFGRSAGAAPAPPKKDDQTPIKTPVTLETTAAGTSVFNISMKGRGDILQHKIAELGQGIRVQLLESDGEYFKVAYYAPGAAAPTLTGWILATQLRPAAGA